MTIRELLAPALLMQETARQRSAVRVMSKRYGLPVMPANLLSQKKETKCAETLFVLGSGESVLRLGDDDWAHVSQHVSIGIGAWTMHPFVPDFLALEHINPNPELGLASESETLVERSYRQALEGWHLRDYVGKVGTQILFFRPPATASQTRLDPLQDFGVKNSWVYGRVGASSLTLNGLRTETQQYFRMASWSAIPPFLPFDTGATASRMISLGARAGFKKIVLLGIDLRDSRYFWDANPALLAKKGMERFVTVENSGAHSTEWGSRFSMSDVLGVLQDFLMKRAQTSLFAGHPSSWLPTRLPDYPWPRSGHQAG